MAQDGSFTVRVGPFRVALYVRVSTVDKGQDVENQLAELRRYCGQRGWQIEREYMDHGSGKSADRDELRELFADAAKRKFDVVVVWALDRFTREGVFETFRHVEKLRGYGVGFESYTEPHFSTTGPAGELMMAVSAWIAKQERLRIGERTKAGLAVAKRKGKRLGRPLKVFRRDEAVRMRGEGKSWARIAEELGVAVGTVRDAVGRGA